LDGSIWETAREETFGMITTKMEDQLRKNVYISGGTKY